MDIEAIMQIISTLGFPIAVCVYLFWRENKVETQHKEEMDKMSTAIANNTLVMQRLVDKIGGTDGTT